LCFQIYIFDGSSYNSKLIGSYSGQTDPEDITAFSGSMLILLFSDTNYVLEGFKALFSITNCQNNCSNHGLCINHSCLCTGEWVGRDCGRKACDCGDEENRGFCNKNRCECSKVNGQWSGQTCSLHKSAPEQSQWHWLTNSTNSFTKRAAHTAIYHEKSDSVYIYGGYDLNNVLGSLEIFRFNTSLWEDSEGNELKVNEENYSKQLQTSGKNEEILDKFWFRAVLMTHASENPSTPIEDHPTNFTKVNKIEPQARYSHAACLLSMEDAFVIFGGKLANGGLSNELWLYNISINQWVLRATKSKFLPPKLTRHSLTYVDSNNYIYLFGGALENGEFSSQMFRIQLDTTEEDEQWEEVFARGGKTMDYRIVAHTTNFHKVSNSLIVYGGITANIARLSKLSDRIFSFDIENQHWTEIFYPKTVLREMSIPRERAFHTATIAGNYLIIFGGYTHRHNKEEICYDNQMFLYHLGCQVWIGSEALGLNRSSYPKKQGVFAHACVMRADNTLLLLGGYHGNVNNDFLAFTLHSMMIPSNNITESDKCVSYKTSNECIANPECGYCSSDNNCYGRTMSNCFTNLQTTRCPGICSSLKDCQSCLIHGSFHSETKLPIGECTWCVQNAKCRQKNDYSPCGESDFVEKIGK
jgi:multipile epidermal growth factor-like domains protein 8